MSFVEQLRAMLDNPHTPAELRDQLEAWWQIYGSFTDVPSA